MLNAKREMLQFQEQKRLLESEYQEYGEKRLYLRKILIEREVAFEAHDTGTDVMICRTSGFFILL